jgi:hypothetical protein
VCGTSVTASIQKSGAHIKRVCCFCHFEAKRNNCLDLRKNCVCMYKDMFDFGLVFASASRSSSTWISCVGKGV